MMINWLSVWHLLVPLAIFLLVSQRSFRRSLFYGGLTALPVLLLIPTLSPTLFEIFNPSLITEFFISQALIVFSLGVVATGIYERVIRPKTIRVAKSRRHHFLLFSVGLALALILFDIFGQPLLPSIIFGLAINFLLAIRYQSQLIDDIVYSVIFMSLFYVFIYVAVLFDLPGEAGRFWFTDSLSGMTLFGMAVEKIITVFVFGSFWGPLYVGLKDAFGTKS